MPARSFPVGASSARTPGEISVAMTQDASTNRRRRPGSYASRTLFSLLPPVMQGRVPARRHAVGVDRNMRVKCAWSAKPAASASSASGVPGPQPGPREIESSHERVAIRTRPVPGPELAGELVAAQARDRLELGRAHDVAPAVQERAGPVERGLVEVARRAGRPAVGIALDQAFRQAEHQGVERQRLRGGPERGRRPRAPASGSARRARGRTAAAPAGPGSRAPPRRCGPARRRRSDSRTRPRPRRGRRASRRGGARPPRPARCARRARDSRTPARRPR